MGLNLCDRCAADCRHERNQNEIVVGCGMYKPPMTNADRIRAMSDEELAAFLERVHVAPCSACCDNLYWCRRNNAPEPVCKNHFLEWLQQPAEEGT